VLHGIRISDDAKRTKIECLVAVLSGIQMLCDISPQQTHKNKNQSDAVENKKVVTHRIVGLLKKNNQHVRLLSSPYSIASNMAFCGL